jgi:hypothetical protein
LSSLSAFLWAILLFGACGSHPYDRAAVARSGGQDLALPSPAASNTVVINAHYSLRIEVDQRVIVVGGLPVHPYRAEDAVAEAYAMVFLVESALPSYWTCRGRLPNRRARCGAIKPSRSLRARWDGSVGREAGCQAGEVGLNFNMLPRALTLPLIPEFQQVLLAAHD